MSNRRDREIGKEIERRAKEFQERLEAGEPIPVIILKREMTPDGPLTTHEHGVIVKVDPPSA